MSQTIHQIITDKIIQLLETGEIPWQTIFKRKSLPKNGYSRRYYGGINVLLLATTPFQSPHWFSFNQVSELGGTVRKGQKSTLITFWKLWRGASDEPDAGSDEPDSSLSSRSGKRAMLRYYNVFNSEQCENLPPEFQMESPNNSSPTNPISAAQELHAAMPLPPSLIHDHDKAYYSVLDDAVNLPSPARFVSPAAYFGAMAHELIHSTRHSNRLDRRAPEECPNSPRPFGSENYSKEELVAELGAAFLSAELGIEGVAEMQNHAAYIQGWIAALKADPKLITIAASQAQKAADYIRGRQQSQTSETTKAALAA